MTAMTATAAAPPAVPPAAPVVPPAAPPPANPAPAPAMPAAPTAQAKPAAPPELVGGKRLAQWVADFASPDPTVRDSAVKVLPAFGYQAVRKTAIKPLLALLDDPDPGVRINAILVISAVGFDKVEEVRAAADKLAEALRKTVGGSMIRLHAARCLAGFGPEAHKAVPALILASEDPAWEIRQAVAAALGRVGMGDADDVPVSDGLVTGKATRLARGPSDQAMKALNLKLIRDPSSAVRLEACQALVVMGPPVAAPAAYPAKAAPLIQAVAARLAAEKDAGVKVWLQLLAIMYDDRQFDAVLKSLTNQAGSPDPQVRYQALQALQVLGPRAKPALNSITSSLSATESYVAVAGIATLLSLGDDAKVALPDLERLAKDSKDEWVKYNAAEAVTLVKKMRDPVGGAKKP